MPHLFPPRASLFDDFHRIPWLLLICESICCVGIGIMTYFVSHQALFRVTCGPYTYRRFFMLSWLNIDFAESTGARLGVGKTPMYPLVWIRFMYIITWLTNSFQSMPSSLQPVRFPNHFVLIFSSDLKTVHFCYTKDTYNNPQNLWTFAYVYVEIFFIFRSFSCLLSLSFG